MRYAFCVLLEDLLLCSDNYCYRNNFGTFPLRTTFLILHNSCNEVSQNKLQLCFMIFVFFRIIVYFLFLPQFVFITIVTHPLSM